MSEYTEIMITKEDRERIRDLRAERFQGQTDAQIVTNLLDAYKTSKETTKS